MQSAADRGRIFAGGCFPSLYVMSVSQLIHSQCLDTFKVFDVHIIKFPVEYTNSWIFIYNAYYRVNKIKESPEEKATELSEDSCSVLFWRVQVLRFGFSYTAQVWKACPLFSSHLGHEKYTDVSLLTIFTISFISALSHLIHLWYTVEAFPWLCLHKYNM